MMHLALLERLLTSLCSKLLISETLTLTYDIRITLLCNQILRICLRDDPLLPVSPRAQTLWHQRNKQNERSAVLEVSYEDCGSRLGFYNRSGRRKAVSGEIAIFRGTRSCLTHGNENNRLRPE
ncbi:hypothetical protein L596_000789 [Steinernema carpocapsae]|uniref:Secreted protein n=1 Tax=Steinernema carpocapsae TaxID=34508 RepID=A0A4U8ULG9_STECR|nr:hypothetical protein L596_000789 [Steinernema carpocapsae]